MDTSTLCLLACGLGSVAANAAVAITLRRQASRQSPPLSLAAGTPRPGLRRRVTVSVAIPARDEERNIVACVLSAAAQGESVAEVVVCDDGSRDATAALVERIASQNRHVRLVRAGGVPRGWTGKCHAMDRLVHSTTEEYILFLDADTTLSSGAVAVAIEHMTAQRLDGLSCLGTREACTAWDRVWEPLWPSLLYCATGDLDGLSQPECRRRFASGAWMLLSREAYARTGGYARIRGEVVEDCAMAGLFKRCGLRFAVANAPELYSLRMYDSLRALFAGWSKNAYRLVTEMLGHSPTVFFLAVAAVLWMTVAPFAVSVGCAMAGVRGFGALLAYGPSLFALATWALVRRATGDRAWLSVTLPISGLLVSAVMLTSAFRSLSGLGVTWKERRYV